MLRSKPDDWAEWGISDECGQFFCLHWTELLDQSTPDTWQVRSSNVKTILRELIDASKIADGFDAYRGVMRAILDEAFSAISHDEILKNSYPFVSAYLEPWRKAEVGEKSVSELERLALVLLGNLDKYWSTGVDLLLSQLSEADPNQKKRLYSTSMNLAVETVSRGHSPSFLRKTFIARVLTASNQSFCERVREYFEELAFDQNDFEVTFLTEGIKKSDSTSLPADIRLEETRAIENPSTAEKRFYKTAGLGAISLVLDVNAPDPEAALNRAAKRVGELFGGINLFSIDERFGIKQTLALVSPKTGEATTLSVGRLGSQYLGSYESRHIKIDQLFRVQQRLHRDFPRDSSQLAAAVEYHRLALQATSNEARLVNLWIALEALCQGGDGSIIERVWSRVAPCVSLENVRKTLASNCIYLRSLWNRNPDRFSVVFPNSDGTYVAPEDLANVLLLPDGDEQLKELCQLCSENPLILHRLFRAKSMMLDKPSSVKGNIDVSCQNVEWQIKRIYRVRNAIVHTGGAGVLLPQLTQHLHCYLVKTIHVILTDLDKQPMWTIRDSLEHRLKLFKHVSKFFETTPGDRIAIASLLAPENCLCPQIAPFAWRTA